MEFEVFISEQDKVTVAFSLVEVNQAIIAYDQKENYSTNYMQSKTTGDKELEYTKSLEFKPGKRPEEAIQGNVIRFMYSPSSDPSAYWLQGTLNARIDKFETAVKSGW